MTPAPRPYSIQRYDFSRDKSLQAWNAADEILLQNYTALEFKPSNLAIYNDRFGFLGCSLHRFNPLMVLTHQSQKKSIEKNLKAHDLEPLHYLNPLTKWNQKVDIALIKIPKSLGLFRLFLEHLSENSSNNITVLGAFMTRHFNSSLLNLAKEYFEEVTQGQAVKKARVITLAQKKRIRPRQKVISLSFQNQNYQQYLGVFSGEHIDYATQFFLKHIIVQPSDLRILDVGSGNGIIGNEIHLKHPDAQ